MTVEAKCILGLTRFQPNSMTPRKEASRKKAVRDFVAQQRPQHIAAFVRKYGPVGAELEGQNHPETTPIPKVTAKILTHMR